ncbi:MAG: ThuA domain-containing protein [Verrucomicrobiales bacterium]|nr:ThuA domain-containing protein [Verrucomicrobiales bacterium]MCP5558581.1 ThuA domain-containing protein [Verrucomicrobiaceae bacterium]
MKKILLPLIAATLTVGGYLYSQTTAAKPKPLRVLLVTGGCCHDYVNQQQLLKTGIESRINAIVDVAFNPDTTTKATFEIYKSKDWAKDFDVVIHDECSADVTDPEYVNTILDAHRAGKPAVNLHCAMHCYRWGNFREAVAPGADNSHWYEMLGLQSTAHGPKTPIDITFTDTASPITKGMTGWTTVDEELYNNVQIFPSAHALATGKQMQKPKVKKGEKADPNAVAQEVTSVVAWTNEFGPNKTRIFSTTIGHQNETVGDARYLDLVSNGLLWATGHLGEDGKAAEGYGK